jgi:hypothetical protein
MSDRWSSWTSFPYSLQRDDILAHDGPGVYEVCNTSSREQVAFGCTRNIAEALGDVLQPKGLRKWLLFRHGPRFAISEVEYRFWPTATFADAKSLIGVFRGQRGSVLRRFTAARI